jgi:CheY-like chemotaxis protein/DNA-binding XRE family transcriptional regulator
LDINLREDKIFAGVVHLTLQLCHRFKKPKVTHSLLLQAMLSYEIWISVGKNDVKKQFGAAVRHYRDQLGISQEELAGRAGLHRTYISDVERGARNVSLESISRLAEALEIPLSVLFSRLEQGSSSKSAPPALSPDDLVDILIVEDSTEDAELTLKALRDVKITNTVCVVRDGAAALDFLFCKGAYAQRKQGQRPQIILLDLGLPKIDGLEVLRQIKADPRTRTIPVIVLTVSSRDRDIAASQRLGAEAYIVKPVDFQNLSGVTPQLSLQWALLKRAPMVNV